MPLSSEVKSSRLWPSRRRSTWGHFSLKSGHVSVPQHSQVYRQPHCHLTSPPIGTAANIPRHRIFPETRFISLAYILSLIVWVYLHSNLCSALQKTHLFCNRVRFGRSRSSKVDDLGTNRKRLCDFLLVRHCDYDPILLHFWGTATNWLKIVYFSYPTIIRRPRSLCSLWNFAVKLTTRKLESWGYPTVKTQWSYLELFWHSASVWQTDRRTDGRTDRRVDLLLLVKRSADAL